jgi:hypothetical protein
MSLDAFMHGQEVGADPIIEEANRVLGTILGGRGRTDAWFSGQVDTATAGFDGDVTCLVRMIGGDWGVYGVGVVAPPTPYGQFRRVLLLHPLWLAMDMAAVRPGVTFIEGERAEWARPRLEDLLNVHLDEYLFQASTAPEPSLSAGAKTLFNNGMKFGTLGPCVTWWADPATHLVVGAGSAGAMPEIGFLTAGHATDGILGSTVEVAVGGTPTRGIVDDIKSAAPYPHPVAVGAAVGGTDAALLRFSGATIRGSGHGAGAAAATSVVTKDGAATKRTEGTTANYMVWCGGPQGIWSNCYGIVLSPQQETRYQMFSDMGDSGSGVTRHDTGEVIGIVVGRARTVSGCPQSVSYIQDIATIETGMQCAVLP